MSGYCCCACRDCFDIAIGDYEPVLCSECQDAGCDAYGESECYREDNYWGVESEDDR